MKYSLKIIALIILLAPLHVLGSSTGFIQNYGQFQDQNGNQVNNLLYMAHVNGLCIQLFDDHFAYEIKLEDKIPIRIRKGQYQDNIVNEGIDVNYSRVEFYFNNSIETIETKNSLKAYYNYINSHGTFNAVKSFEEIIFRNVYAGIDLQFIAGNNQFKYNFILHPGAEINDIELSIKGGKNVYLANNELHIETNNGLISEQIPISYYLDKENNQLPIDITYSLANNILSFNHLNDKDFNQDMTLIIDPIPDIIWATYAGGEDGEYLEGIVIDSNQNINAAGFSSSTTNIATTGAYDGTFDGVFDVYIVQFSPDGTKNWGTYFGGASYDRAYGITCSADNNLYIVGNTYSPGMATAGVQQTFQVNGDEALVAKFDNNGFRIWSTYYGGDQHDFGAVIAVDDNNNTYITGHTYSTDYIATAGMYKETFTGLSNAFISKFDDNGILQWGTYYGEQLEEGWGIGVDANANVYVGGSTQSTFGISSPGAHQTTFGGYNDAFLTKFDTDGNFLWGTYYGDINNEQAFGLSVTQDGYSYLAGITSSPTSISFGDVYQPTPSSVDDGFVSKFAPDGSIIWGTYIGGDGADYIYCVDFGPDSNIVVAGMTLSLVDIAEPFSYDNTWNDFYDGFIISLDDEGGWRHGTYYGGEDHDEIRDVDVDPTDFNIVVTGTTQSITDMTTAGSQSEIFPGGPNDTFIARFCNPIFPKLSTVDSNIVCDNNDEIIQITNATAFSSVLWSTAETTDSITISGLPPGNYTYYVDGVDTNGCITASDTLTINYFETVSPIIYSNPGALCANDTLTSWTDSGFNSYLWSTGGTDTLEQSVNILAQDSVSIYVIITDSNGCEVSSDTSWVEIWPIPDATISLDSGAPFCMNDSILVSVSTTNTHDWNNGADSSNTIYMYSSPGNYDIIVQVISDDGCIDNDTLKISIDNCISGFNENESLQLNIYPIPFTDKLNIQMNEVVKLSIYSSTGQLVYHTNLSGDSNFIELNLKELDTGTYTLVIENEKGRRSKKIIKL